MAIFCSKCGKENSEEAKFCISCGQRLSPGKEGGLNFGNLLKNKKILISFCLIVLLVAAFVFVYPKIKKGGVVEGEVIKSQAIATLPIFDKKTPLSRKIELIKTEKNEYAAKVTISLKNLSTTGKKNLEIVELIPKEFAQNVKEINFSIPPTKVLKDDPLIVWKFDEIPAGESINITYSSQELSLSPQEAEEEFNGIANSYNDLLLGKVEEEYQTTLEYIAAPVEPAPDKRESKFLQDFYQYYYRPYDQWYIPIWFNKTPRQYFEDQKNAMLEDTQRYSSMATFAQGLKTYYDFIGLYGNTVVKLDVIGAIDKLYDIYKDLSLPTTQAVDDVQNCYHLVEFADNLEKSPTILKDPDVRKYFSDFFFQLIVMQQVEDQQQIDVLRAMRYGLGAKITDRLIELHEKAERGGLNEEEAQRLAYLEVAYYRTMAEITAIEIKFWEWTISHIDLSDIIFGWWFPGASKEDAQDWLRFYQAYEEYFIQSAQQRVVVINWLLGSGPLEQLITKDVSQLVLTQNEAGRDFQFSENDYMESVNPDLSLGCEKGYEAELKSPDGVNFIYSSALKYISLQSAQYIFKEYLGKVSPSVFVGEDVQADLMSDKKFGDDTIAYKVTKPGENGVIYLYFFRTGNIIEMLMVGSYDYSLTENDADNYAKIIERKINQ